MVPIAAHDEFASVARDFVAAAFPVLRSEHVIPTSLFHPYIAVGRDYYGRSIMALSAYKALEDLLNARYPERFSNPLKRRGAEFASTYIFGLLEGCVARSARASSFNADGPAIRESIDELLAILADRSYTLISCRHVSHLTTVSGREEQVGDVVVVPEPEGFDGLVERIAREIPGAPHAWNRDDPRPYDPPHSLLILREHSAEPEPYQTSSQQSARLERFLLLARLLTAGTVQSTYQVRGMATLISRMRPTMDTFPIGHMDSLVRRTVRLSGRESDAFGVLGALIDNADVKREGMVATSFDVALSKFNGSHSGNGPFEHLVDLATALEAALIGGDRETEGLTLRLRSRVAALLSTSDDGAKAIFDDVGQLYTLRSKLVHGGQIREKDLRRIIERISTVPTDTAAHSFGVAVAHAVDRMRDLVRRAILARLCLASSPSPLWRFDEETAVDAILAEDTERCRWRDSWHEHLEALGVGFAARRPRSAVDFLSEEDK